MRKGEKTKLRILRTSVELSYMEGFENINFNQLARICKISQPAFYKYFNNKNDLLYNCLLYCASNGRDFIDKTNDPNQSADQRLINYIKGNLNWSKKHPEETHIIISMYSYSHKNTPIKETFNIITETGINRIESILLAGERESLWMIDDSRTLANLIQSMIMGEIIKRFNNSKFKTQNQKFIETIFKVL